MKLMQKFRKLSLPLAESFDAWRIIPRLVLIAYSALVLNMYLWFKSIPTFAQEKCDVAMLKLLLDSKVDLEQAKSLACSIVDVVGGPTAAQSAFITTITGLAAGIFGLYTATGRNWSSGMPPDIDHAGGPHSFSQAVADHIESVGNPVKPKEKPKNPSETDPAEQ